ncbi:GGDEF domain-containing protein [Actinoplanes italicus]|uniref:Diguanylate cyclase (GGDEF)-like protein n=1 Tax=Actinoplanes italicus TaxID=113567 RepID=A0A2T0K2R3_9ACTN|nr:GGDEF domain-containing protein [Actinoplanes italicus]PRX17126.1 diguanylate cyclase (GGDEF)-like protein [Actinoplanes italicus]
MRLRTALGAGAAVALVVQCLHFLLPLYATFALSDAVVAAASGYAAFFYRRRMTDGGIPRPIRVALGCGALACAMWSFSNVLLLASVTVLPAVALAGSLLSTAAAGFVPVALILAWPRLRGIAAARRALDVAAVFGAAFALAWTFVFAGSSSRAGDWTNKLVLVGLLMLAAALALVTLAGAETGSGPSAQQMLAAATLTQALTLLGGLRNEVDGVVWYANGVGAGFVMGAWVMAISSRLAASRGGDGGLESLVFRPWALLPYAPVVCAVAVGAARQAHAGRLDPVLVWTLLATFSLVLLRQFMTLLTVGRLAAVLREQRDTLVHQAHHDGLTGLLNRAEFEARAARVLAGEHDEVTAMILDLDGFKPVNDTFGHAAGDDVLIVVAQRMNAELRSGDLVSRIGGDEFAILLTGAGENAEEVAARLLERIAEPIRVQGHTVTVGGSIGLATIRTGDEPLATLLRRADTAMYAAKSAGKGTFLRHAA